jgi:nucleobase:cation symporter-1, NCS1 family
MANFDLSTIDPKSVTVNEKHQQHDVQEVGSSESIQPSLFRRFDAWIRLDTAGKGSGVSVWSNADLEPTIEAERTWSSWNFVAYWLCDAIAPGNLRLGSSLVTLGLSWRSAVGVIALGHFIAALLITANGIIGARLHVPYTIQSRASFGFFFSFFVVFVRLVVGFFWYGINTYNGALCIHAVLVAIWPSFAKLPNRLPESANITTQMMTGMPCAMLLTCKLLTSLQHT